MIWALIEVVLPMLLTFLFGLVTGWWLWRRHRAIAFHNQDTAAGNSPHGLATATASGGADRNGGSAANDGVPHKRTIQEQALAKELTAANASIRSLVAELGVAQSRLQACESQLSADENSTANAVDGGPAAASGANAVNINSAAKVNNTETDGSPSQADTRSSAELAAALEQLTQLQQRYQELETSHSVDRAELAKKQHLEVRLNNLTKELTENKSQLVAAKSQATRLQSEVDTLSGVAHGHSSRQVASQRMYGGSTSIETDDCPAKLAQLETRLAEIAPVAEQAREYQAQVAALNAKLEQSESRLRQVEASGQRIDQLDSQLQTRLAEELEKSQQHVAQLEQKASQSADKAAELVRTRSRIATLESELGDANSRAEDAGRLQRRVSELEAMLKGSEVKAVNERLVEAEAQLRIANNRVADQQQQIQRLQKSTSAEPGSASVEGTVASAQDESLRRQRGKPSAGTEPVAAASASTGEDESAPESKANMSASGAGRGSNRAEARGSESGSPESSQTDSSGGTQTQAGAAESSARPAPGAKKKSPPWQVGVTQFGTPAASHKDDLKVIRGIGPVLERTLNKAEIQTWDQLAALSADEVALIEQSIDFPGRMTREKWVEQATELVALYPDTNERPSGRNLLPKKS